MITNIITATVTAYCACKICCGSNAKGITANGQRPKAQYTIAGPRKYAFGTIVQIDGKSYTIHDRLAKKYDSRFDIYFDSHQRAKQWGKQTKQVTVITK
jgi:3D (Asp-Asp-Asp) domain-containing protein